METALIAIAIISLAAAAGFGALAMKVLRAERRRSAARVAQLAAALHAPSAASPAAPPAPVAVSSMFGTRSGGSVSGLPLIKAGVVAAMAIMLIVVVAMANRDHDEPAVAVTQSDAAAPLELVSMRHARDGSTLTVTGLVRNPRGGASWAGVTAVVFAFDRAGTFVASGRAPLDFISLAPGDESPFVVSLANVADVGRYRVSFRTESGVLRHVDRRTADPPAAAAASRAAALQRSGSPATVN